MNAVGVEGYRSDAVPMALHFVQLLAVGDVDEKDFGKAAYFVCLSKSQPPRPGDLRMRIV